MVLSICAVNLFPVFGISVYTHVSQSKIYIDIVIAVIIKGYIHNSTSIALSG